MALFTLFLCYLDQQDLFVKIDSNYSFNITATVLSFTITVTVAYMLIIGISIHVVFWIPIPFYGFTKVFIIIAYRAYFTFTVLAFTFLEIA